MEAEKGALWLVSRPGLWKDLGGAALTNMSVPPTQTAVTRSWSGLCTHALWAPPPTTGSSLRLALPGCMVSSVTPSPPRRGGWGRGFWRAGDKKRASGESP